MRASVARRWTSERAGVVALMVVITCWSGGVSCSSRISASDQQSSRIIQSSQRMPDGKEWTTENLNVNIDGSYCYEGADTNCSRYGRLYTWESAQRVCLSLGDGWRLPTEDEWRQLAKHHGGGRDDTVESRKAAYAGLLSGGSSGFNAVLGGGGIPHDRTYTRVEAHGFYWTSTESSPTNAWFYNFAKGQLSLFRQSEGEKYRALSVRCVKS